MQTPRRFALGLGIVLSLALSPVAFGEDAADFLKQAETAYREGQVQQALGLFQKAASANPNQVDAYYNMGAIYYNLKRYPEALEAFQQLLRIDPQDYTTRYETGRVYAAMGRWDEAMAAYEMVSKASSRYGSAQERIAEIKDVKARAAIKPVTKPAEVSFSVVAPLVNKPDPFKLDGVLPGKPTEVADGFFGPTGVVVDTNGVLYVANFSKNTIMKVSPSGEKKLLATGDGINGPVGMSLDRKTGDLYVANHLDNTISKITPQGQVSVVARDLKKPYNLFLDEGSRMLYVSQQESNSIARVRLGQ